MCTVTYLPAPSGFILTHNRDEAPTRSPKVISREKIGGDTLLFPRDTKAGGAWVGTTKSGKTACLLNGAFLKHHHNPPYRRSRGLMLLDFFQWETPGAFFQNYDLDGIEPFTFLLFQKELVTELRWDGTQRHLKELPPGAPHFWCSATLYPPEMQVRREQVFRDWLKSPITPSDRASRAGNHQSLITLHRTGSVGDPENDFVMNRGGRVCTVSITQVVVEKKFSQMRYFDLLEENQDKRQVSQKQRSEMDTDR